MTRDVAIVAPSCDIAEATAIMQKRGIRRVPVVDAMGKVHGVVALDDLLRTLTHDAVALADAVLKQDAGLTAF